MDRDLSILYEYGGNGYASLAALVKAEAAEGLSYQSVARRIRDGMPLREALKTPSGNNGSVPKRVEYKGTVYPSLAELWRAKAVEGLSLAALATRMHVGWDIDEALATPTKKNRTIRDYVVGEKTFGSLAELARDAGISYNAAVKRMHRGATDEEIYFGKKRKQNKKQKKKKPRGKEVVINGVRYESFSCAYEALSPSCTINTANARVRYGWSIEEALEVVPKIDGRVQAAKVAVEVEGLDLSISEASEKYGVVQSTIRDRLARGASSEQAVGLIPIEFGTLLSQRKAYKNRKKRETKILELDGKKYKNAADLAREYGLDPALVYNRMRDNGWTVEQAVKSAASETVIIRGIEYRSAMNAWEQIGETSFSTYSGRKNSGHRLEVCLGLEPMPDQSKYELEGNVYRSKSEIADACNISIGALRKRLITMSLEEAVSYTPPNFGRYTAKRFEENSELANSRGAIYFVKVRLDEGTLHKVGITRYSVRSRFLGQNHSVIAEFECSLVRAFEIEQSAIKKFEHLLYLADQSFAGRTETFILTEDEEKQMLNFISQAFRK